MKPVACESSTRTRALWRPGQLADLGEGRYVAVHGEDAVGHDEAEAGGGGLAELGLEVRQVHVLVEQPLGLAQTDPVDDRRMVELVGEDGVLRSEQRLEDPAVRVEAGGEEDRVLHSEEAGHSLLELQMQGLRPADEAHAGQSVAPRVEGPRWAAASSSA
jgi:hypothetical protein